MIMSPSLPDRVEPAQVAQALLLMKSLSLCRNALDKLNILIIELQARLGKRKHFGRISITLNKESMQRLVQRLEQCKSLLQLSHQAYMSAQHMTQSRFQTRLLEEIRAEQLVRTVPAIVGPTAMVKTHKEKPRKSPKPQTRLALRITAPGWSFSRVLDLTITCMPAGWSMSLQCYGTLPDDDPICGACCENDVVAVRGMLENRSHSVHDRFCDGLSLFETAMAFGSVEVAQFLFRPAGGVIPEPRHWLVMIEFWFSHLTRISFELIERQEPVIPGSRSGFIRCLEQLGFDRSDAIFEQPQLTSINGMTDTGSTSDHLMSMLELVFVTRERMSDDGISPMIKILANMIGPGHLDPDLLNPDVTDGRSIMHVVALAMSGFFSAYHRRHC